MVPDDNIKAIISALAAELDLVIIRNDQAGQHPPYPFATYKDIGESQESAYQDIREVVEGSGATFADIKRYEKSEATISLNFVDKDRVDRIKDYATNALRWFKSNDGYDTAIANEITVQLLNTTIEDRTIFQEAFFENKIGFDIRFDYTGCDTTEDAEAIGTVTIEVEMDDVEQNDLVVTAS